MIEDKDRGSSVEGSVSQDEARVQALLCATEQSVVGVCMVQDRLFRYVNRHFAETTGYAIDELTNKMGPEHVVHPEDFAAAEGYLGRVLSGESHPLHYEFRMQRKDGETVFVDAYGSRTTYNGRPALVGTVLDVTARRKLEEQLIRSEKMKALGTLAGGIAHDFNNLLMGVQGHTSLMLRDVNESHPHHAKLKAVEELVTSASNLTRQLLGLASGSDCKVGPEDLNEVVRKTSDMFGRARKEIVIESHYDQDLCTVEVDRNQVEQVLLNLYVNAWQAMPDGGTLVLETRTVTLDEDYVKPHGLKPGRYAKISVTDTGHGMDRKTMERIFEPFFTTKGDGKGTGLGLATAYSVVQRHGGIISVYSEKGSGSVFHIYLPASEKQVEKPKTVSPQTLNGSETVLLVDDEETVITVGKDMLEALGYSVLTARTGQEGVQVYGANKDHIKLVILDMVMPDMGGEETLAALKAVEPTIDVVLSSGYSIAGQAKKIMEQGCAAFMQKPFNITTLSQVLRSVLDKKR